MTTTPVGEPAEVERRLDEILARYMRILLGDPDSPAVAQRGADEGLDDYQAGRSTATARPRRATDSAYGTAAGAVSAS